MIPINNLLKFYTVPPAGGAKECGAACCQAATLVDEGAREPVRLPLRLHQ